MAISVVSFSFSRAAQPEAWGPCFLWSAGFLYHNLSPNSPISKLTDFLSSPSYIIVQLLTQYLPITGHRNVPLPPSLEWQVWSSSSGNNCHAEKSNRITRVEIDWLYPLEYVKEQVLGIIFGVTFSDSIRQNLSLHPHCKDILQSTSCEILVFSILVEVVYWPCSLKFVYPTINLAFLEIIVKLNFLWNFARSFEWFCLQISSDAKYFFLSFSRHCDRRTIIVIVYYFWIWI